MAATDEILRVVVQAVLDTLHQDQSWLDEPLDGFPPTDITNLKNYFRDHEVTLHRSFPANAPTSPMIMVIPGEAEEADQNIGSFLDDDEYALEPPATGGEADQITGTWFQTTHHVAIYGVDELLINALSYVMLWSIFVVLHSLEEGWEFYEARLMQSPMQLADEWGAASGNVFRRAVHLEHKWVLRHTDRYYGPFCAGVIPILHDTYWSTAS